MPIERERLTEIREVHRQREDLSRACMRLGQQIGAIRRRMNGGHVSVAGNGQAPDAADFASLELTKAQMSLEVSFRERTLMLKRLARALPVWQRVKGAGMHGLGDLGLAQIVAECIGEKKEGAYTNIGDFSRDELRKRMGLAVINGKAQGRSKLDFEANGFNPRRRAIMHCIGEAAMKTKGPYRELYLYWKKVEEQKAVKEGLTVKPSLWIAKQPASERHKYRSVGHIHRRALRYMEKKMLEDLRQHWLETK